MEEYNEKQINILKTKLIDKLENEFNDYKQNLLNETPEKIIEKSYETAVKQEIIDCFNYDMAYSKDELKTLLKEPNLVHQSYDEWLSTDGHLRDSLEYSVDKLVDIVIEDAKKEKAKIKKGQAR